MLPREQIYISGRHSFIDDILYLGYSASFVDVCLKGTRLEAVITSDAMPDEKQLRAYIGVFVNDEKLPSKRMELKKGEHSYLIYEESGSKKPAAEENAKTEAVKIRIMKYSEAAFATVGIVDLKTDGEFLNARHEEKPLIEFIGDSITCGYGVDAANELITFHTRDENPWEAYACKTAEKCNMDFSLVSWSGIGIISHYVEPSVNERRLERFLMPGLYDYTDRELEERMGKKEYTLWNPVKKPDVIVMNLGTNDCSYTREIPDRNAFFQEEYKKFIRHVREKNKEALLIIFYGIMDERLNKEIECVVKELKEQEDDYICALHAPIQNAQMDGMGADYHPSKITHEKAASLLSELIMGRAK